MRKAFLFLVILVVGLAVLDHHRDHRHDDDTYLEELEHRIQCATWETHYDSAYGYEMHYLSCFVPIAQDGVAQDGAGGVTAEDGTVRFAYVEDVSPLSQITYIMQEVTTQHCADTLNPYREMRKMAEEMRAVCLRKSEDTYLMTGTLKSRDPRVTAYRFSAKYVLRQRLWFVQTVIYPEDFAPALQRLLGEVEEWEPF